MGEQVAARIYNQTSRYGAESWLLKKKTAALKGKTVLIDTDTSESSGLNTALVIEGLC